MPLGAGRVVPRQAQGGKARALVVNSGNANAFTGKTGRGGDGVHREARGAGVGLQAGEVFLASTGVIGEPLPAQRFDGVMQALGREARARPLSRCREGDHDHRHFPEGRDRAGEIGGGTVTINGIAKGAGMIAPDMATMLSFVFTDAPIAAPALQAILSDAVVDTFNAVTIDGDTSTSDTLLAFATGAARARRRSRARAIRS